MAGTPTLVPVPKRMSLPEMSVVSGFFLAVLADSAASEFEPEDGGGSESALLVFNSGSS